MSTRKAVPAKKTPSPQEELAQRKQAVANILLEGLYHYEREILKRRAKLVEFAQWLDVDYSAFSLWKDGHRLPSGQNVHKIANKLGPKIYDVMGFTRPDDLLSQIISAWDELEPEDRQYLAKVASERKRGPGSESSTARTSVGGTV